MGVEDATIESPFGALAVVRATVEHAPAVRALRDDLAEWMLQRGIRQWRPDQLPLKWIERWVALGAVYLVWHEDRLIGSVTIVWDDPIVWGDQAEPAGYIHMLMVDRHFGGHGIGRSLLNWAERSIRQAGHRVARLDCAKDNQPLRSYYERAGYRVVGSKTFPEIAWALEASLYEKRLLP